MKKLLGIIVLGLLLSSNAIADKINFRNIEIETANQKFVKLKSEIVGHFEMVRYFNNFYSHTDNKNLKTFIETFNFEAGSFKTHSNRWFKENVFEKNSEKACYKSGKNIFFAIDQKKKFTTCLVIRIIKNDELSRPSFKKAEYAPLHRRSFLINNYIKKNKIIVPNQMIRAEHYFYVDGVIYWIFFTSEIDVNLKKQIDDYVNRVFKNHKKFENQLNFEPRFQLDLNQSKSLLKSAEIKEDKEKMTIDNTSETKDIVYKLNELKELLNEGLITRKEFDKAKTVLLD